MKIRNIKQYCHTDFSCNKFSAFNVGSETWVLSKSDEARPGVFERKVLRAIFGPTNDNGEWRTKYNDELYTLYKDSDIITYIKINRLRWAGL